MGENIKKGLKLVVIPLNKGFKQIRNVIIKNRITGNFYYLYENKFNEHYLEDSFHTAFHAYLLSEDKYDCGDLVVDLIDSDVFVWNPMDKGNTLFSSDNCMKVIATTIMDVNLSLIDPLFLDTILDDLRAGKFIFDVSAYYKQVDTYKLGICVNDEGFVTPFKQKEIFTREEALQIALRASVDKYDNLNEWFNQNF